jgi:hypothetical protein
VNKEGELETYVVFLSVTFKFVPVAMSHCVTTGSEA